MKTKRTLTIATALVALAALMTLGIFRVTRTARAQDEVGPPIHVKSSDRDRISTGMLGITQGQTLRLSVVNLGDKDGPDPQRGGVVNPCIHLLQLNFRDADGQLLRRADGSVVQQTVELEPGKAKFLDLNYDELPPGPSRQQLRAVVTGLTPPDGTSQQHKPFRDHIVTTVEVFDNITSRSGIVIEH